jgi:hypothetical protein
MLVMSDDAGKNAGPADDRTRGATAATPEEARRKLTLVDAMIAVAAIALALASTRTLFTYLWLNLHAIPLHGPAGWTGAWAFLRRQPGITASIAMLALASVEHLLLFATLAYLIMRLRKPRPTLGHLIWEPGVAATGMLVLSVLLAIVAEGLLGYSLTLTMIIIAPTGCAIPAAWIFIARRGPWDRQPSWIDRLGRAVGACWALILPLGALLFYLVL